MLKCKEITELASMDLDTSITWLQRIEVKIHLLMCKTCCLYVKQIKFIQSLFSGIEKYQDNIVLSNDAKVRILQKINQTNPFGHE